MILFTLKPSWVTSGYFDDLRLKSIPKIIPVTHGQRFTSQNRKHLYILQLESRSPIDIWWYDQTVNKLIVPITLITCSLYNLKKEIIENQQRCHKKHKRFIKKTNNQLDQYWCCKSITIYILNVYHTVSRLFYRYNDIEKKYKKKNQEKVKDVIIHQSNQAKKNFT